MNGGRGPGGKVGASAPAVSGTVVTPPEQAQSGKHAFPAQPVTRRTTNDAAAAGASPGFAMGAGSALVALALVLLGVISVQMLAGVRAYVGGESLYSKGQKNSVLHLLRYLETGEAAEYAGFEQAIAIPIGDRIARTELEKPGPDFARVRQGFVQGGNHADDIDAMVRLYRAFRRVPFMADAIAIWAEGDREVAALEALAQALRDERGAGPLASEREDELRQRILAIDTRLSRLEQDFSATLGSAARTIQHLLVGGTLLLALVLSAAAIGLARRSWRRLALSQQALLEGNERWELAAAAGDIGMFDWDLNQDHVRLDARARRIFGLGDDAPEALERARVRECVHPDDRERLDDALQRAIAEQRSVEHRYRIVRPNGEMRTLELGARAQPGGQRVVGFLWDVTSDVLAERLKVERNAAARASAAKSEFLSRVSHELRTPLNAVIGFTQLMLSDRADPPTPAQTERLRRVEQGGQYLLKLVEDLLALTHIEQGTVSARVENVDLRPLLESAIALLEPARAAREVAIELEAPAPVVVSADPTRLSQVLFNLLSNAIKYNRPQGRVGVELRAIDGWAVLGISDTGFGLAREQIEQLFQPFNRLGAEYSNVDGSGLGLVISRRLVEQFGGSIEFTSDPPRGSLVTVRLPLAATAQAPPAASEVQAASS